MKTYRLKIKEKCLYYVEKGDKKHKISFGYSRIKLLSTGDIINFVRRQI